MEALPLGPGELDLAATLDSGQTFHWQASGKGFAGALGEEGLFLEQPSPRELWCSRGAVERVRRYFALDLSLKEVRRGFPLAEDPIVREAMALFPGLRILRQPLWECLASFLMSALKQVVHIRQCSLRLRQELGRPLGSGVWAFPSPERVAEAGEGKLREWGLGYRAKSVALAAEKLVAEPGWLESLEAWPTEEARRALCAECHGVGEKIADCLLLFGYGRSEVFPVDVWTERVLRELEGGKRRKWPMPKLRDWARRELGPHAGWLQQFLFHWARTTRMAGAGERPG
ncbi:MAG: DNA glycosylase [Verrucomicrobiota bacterium]